MAGDGRGLLKGWRNNSKPLEKGLCLCLVSLGLEIVLCKAALSK